MKAYLEGKYVPTFDESEYVKSLLAESPELKALKVKVFDDHVESSDNAKATIHKASNERRESIVATKKTQHSFNTLTSLLKDIDSVAD